MTVNDIVKDARVAHVRELKAEIASLKASLAAAQAACAAWESHFALALAAARDAARLPDGGDVLILDGWNIVYNAVVYLIGILIGALIAVGIFLVTVLKS